MVTLMPLPLEPREYLEECLAHEIDRKNYDAIRLIAADLYTHTILEIQEARDEINGIKEDLLNPKVSNSTRLIAKQAIGSFEGEIRRQKSNMERYSSLAEEAMMGSKIVSSIKNYFS